MPQQGLFGFALASVVSAAGCSFGSGVGSGAGGSTGASEDDLGDAPAPATGGGDRGDGEDEGTTVGISGTAGSTSDAATTTGPDDDDDDDDDESTSSSSSTGDSTTSGDDTSGSTTAAPLSCDELFMTAPGYVYCDETPTTCSFNASTNGTCNAMCASLGSECVAAFDNPNSAGQECDVIRPNRDTCDTVRGTEICECTRL